MKRRDFIEKGTIGIAGAAALITVSENSFCLNRVDTIDKVNLGKTGLKVSRIALGTGTRGWRNESDQTRLGMSRFTDLAKYAYDRGIHFFDTADMYGSHVYMRQALKTIPRDKITLLTKVMTYDQKGWYKAEPFNKSLDRFRKETGSDYFDIFLMHCMVNGKWPEEYKKTMDDMSEAKSKGIIKTVGISCHSLDALREASENPWVDVILARINHKGTRMDSSPDKVMEILSSAHKKGKGIIGMKIFGCGDLTSEEEREKSLNFVIKSGNIDCMTIGMESTAQIEDTIARVMRIAKVK
jgi:aryl-alcohol dehydrogenase-like predicted oxidoreductase